MSNWISKGKEMAMCGCGQVAEIVEKARWVDETHIMRHENGDWCECMVVETGKGFRFTVVEHGSKA